MQTFVEIDPGVIEAEVEIVTCLQTDDGTTGNKNVS